MLKTEKILNSYGLTFLEADTLLQVDVLSSLMKAKEIDKLSLHVSSLDERIEKYLESEDVKEILENNRKEAIGEALSDDFDIDFGEFELDLDNLDDASGFDVRVTDIDFDDIDDMVIVDTEIEQETETPTPIATAPKPPAPKVQMANAIIFENVVASNFFTQFVRNSIPEVDSDGALVVERDGVLIRGLYDDDFARLGSMALSGVDMTVEILSNDAVAVVEYAEVFGEGNAQEVGKDLLTLPREEVSQVFNTQQYLVNGKEAHTSFDAIESKLNKVNQKGKLDKALEFGLGKAVSPNMVSRSNYYIEPKTLYGLANCDEFFSASVGGYRYITNYCEANDLKQLRIFELGGGHLNVPFSNTRGETITNSVMQDDSAVFSGKVNGIIDDTYSKNERLYEVGFTQVLPKAIKYDKVDNLSEDAGYFVFSSPSSARTFYVSAVIYNYFKKFYGVSEVRAGMTTHSGQYTIYFVRDTNIQGFIMIKKANAPSSSPARLLPKNPLAYSQKILGENAVAFADKVNIEDEESVEFIGEVKSRRVVEEQSLTEMFKEQIEMFEQALEFMEVGIDDDKIILLKDSIEGAELMIDDDDEVQAEEGIQESIDMIADPEDELGQMAVANDQEILPTPSADDSAMEEIIEEEKDEVLDIDMDDIDMDDDFDISSYYAKGGSTAKGGKTQLDKEFKFDKNFVIYVPSTSNVGDRISETELNGRVSEVEQLVADEFGGFTKTETDGGYKSYSGEIIEEDIVKVSVFSTDKAWDENEKGLIRAVKMWAKEWGQESIGFEYEGDLYYIDATTGKMAKGGSVGGEVDSLKDLRKKLIGQDKYIVSHFYDYDGLEDKSYSQIKTIKEGSAVKSFKTITNGVWVDEKISVPNDKYVIETDTIGAYASNELVINKSDLKELSEKGSIEDFRLMWLSDFSEEKWNKWGASLEQQWEFKIGELTDRPFAKGGKTYAEGGEIDTASELAKKMVSSMTDDEVARKVVEQIYGSLDSLESDVREEDALIMAKKDMKSSRRFYEEILKESLLS